jgi:hypothetical protein
MPLRIVMLFVAAGSAQCQYLCSTLYTVHTIYDLNKI